METQVLMNKLSEFLMVEQGGLQLYRVVASRATNPDLKKRYEEFGKETAHHREVLVELITAMGGDPSYVSPTARMAQLKSEALLETALLVDGLSLPEIEANDLENVLLAETKDHADWSLLSQLVAQMPDGKEKTAMAAAVAEVEEQEDEHLAWAQETLSQLCMQMVMAGPPPPPELWQAVISTPLPEIGAIHPSPVDDGLLAGAKLPMWIEAPAVRELKPKK